MTSKKSKTPLMENGLDAKHFPQNVISDMPAHFTPPSGITKFIAQNPFEADLTSRLHLSVISPSVFNTKKIDSPVDGSPIFKWTVDELAQCQPAKIDELLVEQNQMMSPETEKEAQEAIRRFFSENQIAPSPLEAKPKDISRKLDLSTPIRNFNSSFNEISETTKDCWTQTILTFPSKLPEEVEEALKPFFTFTQEQNVESEDANSTNSSLRRKLFDFHNSEHSDESDAENLSPTKNESFVYCGSPLQSGILVNQTPVRGIGSILKRDHGTPVRHSQTPIGSVGSVSPINLSPICNFDEEQMSFQSTGSRDRPKTAARLDFSFNMSVDEDKDYISNDMTTPVRSKQPFLTQCSTEEFNQRLEFANAKYLKLNDFVEQSVSIYSSTFQQNQSSTSHQNPIHLQQCTTNSSYNSHDTGYQTCSMSNMETNDEEAWSENERHIFCSTPSKFRQFVN